MIFTLFTRTRSDDQASIAARRAVLARNRFRRNPFARLEMWRSLSTLSGFDLPSALEIIRKGHSQQGTRPNNLLAMVAESWIPRLRAPEPLADVIAGAVSDRERLFISASRGGRELSETLKRVHHYERKLYEVHSRWKSSIKEPVILLVTSWIMLAFYAALSLDQADVLPQRRGSYGFMANQFCDWFLHVGVWVIPLTLALIVTLVIWSFRGWLNPGRSAIEHVWPWSLYKALAAAEFLQAITTLKHCGETFSMALQRLRSVASPYLRWQIEAIEPLTRDSTIGTALTQAGRLFPDSTVIALLDVYSSDSPAKMPAHLTHVTEDFVDALMARMDRMSRSTSFLTMMVAGLIQLVITILMAAVAMSPPPLPS